ncbi:hypothetical protein Vdis_0140 [Vulcanisaeta distributa DSM 14429]|uniref:Uncharacterized protein n=1 Tax=Vulcanisaeta distributa (strain DSM 14429 / JCM 11212 / NBRC 100878 / IC-017) TaxID=572478 RepID=E1QSN6_VULDI|nr:hypothetical protein Vdis_0140 [Vulcanisaeta distributa DSM 14429]
MVNEEVISHVVPFVLLLMSDCTVSMAYSVIKSVDWSISCLNGDQDLNT